MNQRPKEVGVVIRRLSCGLNKNLEERVKAAGVDEVTLMHGWILKYLSEHQDTDVFQKDIEKYFSIGRSTVTGIIQIMEKKGYISRESVENDARLKKVVLTEKGMENHEVMEGLISQLESELLDGIQPQELEFFFEITNKMQKNLQKIKGKGGCEC